MDSVRDHDFFANAYAVHAPGVHATARRILQDPHQAHDVTHDVFLRLWRDPSCFDPARGELGGFLRRMAHNRALDVRRSRATGARAKARLEAQAERAESTVDDLPAPACERRDLGESVRSAVRGLPDGQREALALAYWGDLPAADVATRAGVPLGTAKSRIRLGLQRLRSQVPQAA